MFWRKTHLELLLSKSSMPLIKYVAQLLGWLIEGIYEVLYRLNIPNIGVAIIFFTIIIYICLTPIQVKQQKMSKVMNIINPELQKIQKKYQGKKDTVSQQKMQEETMALYSKYGVSPTGSCLPLLIQLPILFALYQVILYIPGYISRVADIFNGLASKIVSVNGYGDILAQFVKDNSVRNVSITAEATQKQVVDFLYVLKQSQWSKLADISQFSSFSGNITATAEQSRRINTFLTINISDSPWDAIRTGFSSIFSGHATVIIVVSLLIGIMIPVLAWFTQWLNMKLMPQQAPAGNDSGNSMANQMNTMNNIMPIISAVMCVTFNMGIGIYWIVGAIVRCVQQVVINRRIANLDPQAMIEKAKKKNEKKEQKRKDYTANISQNARTNVKKISPKFDTSNLSDVETAWDSEKVDPNSITAKANMVRSYDEKKNNRKKR
ncbi:YidC/Oxa1 family membrane protein insertase [Lachnospiraceae bacterium Oil+RF-744-WCA-WT-13]|uniref:YidC/Oxa1 family membrane protein insertase n=1 Tax=Bilifractor porci TaxID=2606636 RepID=A0A7X2PA38_9FIRM|nr:YidC/Oxa1 family membrane protein insertase [Bilifractor porci]